LDEGQEMMPVGDMITKPLNYIINGIFPLEAFYSVQEELPLVHIMTIHSRYLSSYLSGCIYINTYNSIPSLLSFYLSIYLYFSLLSECFSLFQIFFMCGVAHLCVAWLNWVCAAQYSRVQRGSTGCDMVQ
jgi:hypothetical protein